MQKQFKEIFKLLEQKGFSITEGLSDSEVTKIEKEYGFSFNLDHLEYLKTGLILGEGFYNWRDFSEDNVQKIKERLNFPLEGILFDIENNAFWYDQAGEKPEKLADQIKVFTNWYKLNVPPLVPIYSHRFMCSEPKKSGMPVYSVHQTDIIFYGENIIAYFNHEFSLNISIDEFGKERIGSFFWNDLVF